LSSFFELPQGKYITKENEAKWIFLLETKIAQQSMSAALYSTLDSLSKILIRNRESQTLAKYVAATLKQSARVANYETTKLAL
jgi:hypothetical protein